MNPATKSLWFQRKNPFNRFLRMKPRENCLNSHGTVRHFPKKCFQMQFLSALRILNRKTLPTSPFKISSSLFLVYNFLDFFFRILPEVNWKLEFRTIQNFEFNRGGLSGKRTSWVNQNQDHVIFLSIYNFDCFKNHGS